MIQHFFRTSLHRGILRLSFNKVVLRCFSENLEKPFSRTNLTLTQPVLQAMLEDSIRVNDFSTLKLVLRQYSQFGDDGVIEIEGYLRESMKSNNFHVVEKIITQATEIKLSLDPLLCNQLSMQAINAFDWETAAACLHYMLQMGVPLPDHSMFLVLAGLMSRQSSLTVILNLIKVALEFNRLDDLDEVSFKKLNHYSVSFGGNQQLQYRSSSKIDRELLWKVMTLFIETRSGSSGKARFTVAKLIVGLALAGRYDEIAIAFAKEVLRDVPIDDLEANGFELDRLSLLKAFAQADQLITRIFQANTHRSSRFAILLMDHLIFDCLPAAEGKIGKLKTLEFYANYWALSFRLKNAALVNSGKALPQEVLAELLKPVRTIYGELLSFNNDVTAVSREISIKPGMSRRLMRVICDEAGLRHKLLVPSIKSNDLNRTDRRIIFQVWKVSTSSTMIPLPSLDQILQKDMAQTALLQRLDLLPIHWSKVSAILANNKFDEELLRSVLLKLALSMTYYPSLSWILLMIEICQARSVPIPKIVWRRSIKMCAQRSDIFGLLEILHAAEIEQSLYGSDVYSRKLNSYQLVEKEDLEEAPLLSVKDWNSCIDFISHGRRSILQNENYQEAFMEYVRLRHNAGVDLDEHSLKALIKFLTSSKRNEEMLQTLLFKRYRDPTSSIDHVECCSISKLLVYKARLNLDFYFTQPLFLHPSYLQFFPHTLDKIYLDFVSTWLVNKAKADRFAKAWNSQHTPEGRKEVFEFTRAVVQENLNKQAAMDEIALSALLGMVVHVSYMKQMHDSEHREAFDLLCLSYLLLSERAVKKRMNQDEEMLTSAEDSTWERYFSPEDQAYYFYNPYTNECIWDEANFQHEPDSTSYEAQQSVCESVGSLRSGISDPRLSVVDRSNLMMELKKSKIAKLQQEMLLKEQAVLQTHPNITKKSTLLNRSVEDMLAWEENRKQRLIRQAEEKVQQESAEITGKPIITKRAEQLSRRKTDDNYEAQFNDPNVVRRLHHYEERKQIKIQRIREEEELQARKQAVPKITSYSRELSRKDRAHDDRFNALSRLQLRTEEFLEASRLETHDEFTGQKLFAPVLNRTSQKLATRNRESGLPIEDLLQQKGRVYKSKQEERERRKKLEEQRLSEINKVNKVSEKIVREKFYLTGETVVDRLHRPIGSVKQRTLETIDQPTFQPQISRHSEQILSQSGYSNRYLPSHEYDPNQTNYESLDEDKDWNYGAVCVDGNEFTLLPRDNSVSSTPKSGPDSLYYRFTMWDEQRRRRLDLDRQHKERLEMSECSFKPRSSSIRLAKQYKHGSISERDLSERHAEWMRKREDKLNHERNRQTEDQMRECTFVPKVPLPRTKDMPNKMENQESVERRWGSALNEPDFESFPMPIAEEPMKNSSERRVRWLEREREYKSDEIDILRNSLKDPEISFHRYDYDPSANIQLDEFIPDTTPSHLVTGFASPSSTLKKGNFYSSTRYLDDELCMSQGVEM